VTTSIWKGLEKWQKALIILLLLVVLVTIVGTLVTAQRVLNETYEACSAGDLKSCRDWPIFVISTATSVTVVLIGFIQSFFSIVSYKCRKAE